MSAPAPRGRLSAGDRVRRLLALIPWVASHPEGVPVDEVCRRFSIQRRTLLADLDSMLMVGVDAIGPESFVDVVVDEDRVHVTMAQWFDRPLRLTPEQALALVAAGQGLLVAGSADDPSDDQRDDRPSPLARGLAKLAEVLGVEPGAAVDVRLPSTSVDVLRTIQAGAREHRSVDVEYYGYGRDEVTRRRIDPVHLFADEGFWYVLAHCHLAGAERVFRLDRVRSAVPTDESFAPPEPAPGVQLFAPGDSAPRVTLDLAAEARWVAEQYPVDDVEELPDGGLRVRLAVSGLPWLERLLLRLGPAATVVAAEGLGDDPAALAPAAARRLLARYRG